MAGIGEYAFKGCEALTNVTISGSATAVGEGAFELCDALTLMVEPSSYAEQYAMENGITYAYPESTDGLNG